MHKSNKRYKLHSVVSRACKAGAYRIDIRGNTTGNVIAHASWFIGMSGKQEYHWEWKHGTEWLTSVEVNEILQRKDITVCLLLNMVDD